MAKSRIEKIAEKLQKVAAMTFKKAYKRLAYEWRARNDKSISSDPEVVTMGNSTGVSGLHFTLEHRGKMEGMYSLSTCCKNNHICQRNRQIEGSICQKCFAFRQMEYMTSMEKPLEQNRVILTSEIIEEQDLPIINAAWFRFESFGDLENEIQAINYLDIIRKNHHCFFAWWTKSPAIIARAFEITGYEKPQNLNIIYSSMFIDVEATTKYPFVDKIFTVYSESYLAEHPEVKINCGARSCLKCRLCYGKNDVRFVNEIEK